MIIPEHPFAGRDDLIRQNSDISVKLRKMETGETYDEAVDLVPCPYNYEETDIPIEEEPTE